MLTIEQQLKWECSFDINLLSATCHDKHFFGVCKLDAKDTEVLVIWVQMC